MDNQIFLAPSIKKRLLRARRFLPLFALLQAVVDPARRATAAASFAMVAALIGLGLGPLVIGALSDHFSATQGPDSLRIAMLITGAIAVPWCLAHLIYVRRILQAQQLR